MIGYIRSSVNLCGYGYFWFVLACLDPANFFATRLDHINPHPNRIRFFEDIWLAMTKFILVSGGVVSGIGKGVIGTYETSFSSLKYWVVWKFLASSTGLLLKTIGLKVSAIKIDPYMNIDAGTIRPTEHGKIVMTNRPIKQLSWKLKSRGGLCPERWRRGRSGFGKLWTLS